MGILDAPSYSRVQADARFAQGVAPSDVGTRAGRFDSVSSTYWPAAAALRKTRGKLASTAAGIANSRLKIAFVGDSETSGFGSTVGVNDTATAFRKILANRGYPVGTGLVTSYNNNGGGATQPDSRWTFGTGWNYAGGAYGSQNIQLHRKCGVAGAVATFVSDVPGTVVEFWTFGNTDTLSFTIDGGAPQTVTPSGNFSTQLVTVTGLTNAVHTVAITAGTVSSGSYILGVNVRPAAAVEVSAFGFWGAESRDWIPALWYNAYQDVISYSPDLVLLQLGVNDDLHGRGTTELTSNLTTLLTNYQSAGFDVALITSASPSGTAASWAPFRNVHYNLADSFKVPLVDLTHRLGTNAQATANGVMFDTNHPNAAGYTDSAVAVARLLNA